MWAILGSATPRHPIPTTPDLCYLSSGALRISRWRRRLGPASWQASKHGASRTRGHLCQPACGRIRHARPRLPPPQAGYTCTISLVPSTCCTRLLYSGLPSPFSLPLWFLINGYGSRSRIWIMMVAGLQPAFSIDTWNQWWLLLLEFNKVWC
jgi:hypothetical protein